jgi:hypothetical protein
MGWGPGEAPVLSATRPAAELHAEILDRVLKILG